MGASAGGGKGGGGGAGMMRPPMPSMNPSQMEGGMGRSLSSFGQPQVGSGQSTAVANAMQGLQSPRPQVAQQAAPDMNSIMSNQDHPSNPLSQIKTMMSNVAHHGEETIKGIFSGQWKDALSTQHTRTQSLMGRSIANPYLGADATDVPSAGILKNINAQQLAKGMPITTMSDYGQQEAPTGDSGGSATSADNPMVASSRALESHLQPVPQGAQPLESSLVPAQLGMSPVQANPLESSLPRVPKVPGTEPSANGRSSSIGDLSAPAQQNQLQQSRASQPTSTNFGALSTKYETGNRGPGFISDTAGDKGGASYGDYQLAANAGSLSGFLKETKYGSQFKGLTPASSSFNTKWKQVARTDSDFGVAHYNYIDKRNYQPVRKAADALGVPSTNAVNQALFSTGVQHGSGGGRSIVQKIYKQGMSEPEFINALYDKRSSIFENSKYYNSSASRRKQRAGVLNRFKNERQDALDLIEENTNGI